MFGKFTFLLANAAAMNQLSDVVTENKTCSSDSDCEKTHFCLKQFQIQNESVENWDFPGVGCAWKASCQGTATWIYPEGLGTAAVQFICTEEQAAEAEGLEIPFSDWELSSEKLREKDWEPDCTTPGEECDLYHTCVDRFD